MTLTVVAPVCGHQVTKVVRGMCRTCYERWRSRTPPADRPPADTSNKARKQPSPIERFWAATERRGDDECWPWLAAINAGGYGHGIMIDGRKQIAHRAGYMLLVGPIPEGLTLDHLCRNTRCVNPAHMEPVTAVENVLRGETVSGINSRKTECIHGHEFTPENTMVSTNARGLIGRRCRECDRAHGAAQYLRRKAARQQRAS